MLKRIFGVIKNHKLISSFVALVLIICITALSIVAVNYGKKKTVTTVKQEPRLENDSISVEETVKEEEEVPPIEQPTAPVSKPTPKPVQVSIAPAVNTDFKFNTNINPDNNVFLDALRYCGYNLDKHRADGLMWQYILWTQKRAKGWLSNITYGGGCTGYETTADGKPDIARFEKGGLVCATYAAYVYFNYLPNVAGIDTSSLPKPDKSYSANDWYIAAKKWISLGFSTSIPFRASSSGNLTVFNCDYDIPIGSLILFCDFKNRNDYCTHICIYAGYVNSYHWVTHVGNANGPEFCAIERMSCGADPQWPLMVVSAPSNIRMSAALEVFLKDNNGVPIANTQFVLKNNQSGKETVLTTDNNGRAFADNLLYGEYTVTQKVPLGYTCDNPEAVLNLTTQNNSLTGISFTDMLIPEPEPEPIPSEQEQSSNDSAQQSDVLE